jgi:dTDP-4-dehydrorhamnose reductase
MMRVLVAGAAGMLGADVVAVAGSRGHECFGLARAELDVTDEHAVEATIARLAPEAIVNCAAWTDVEGAESLEPAALAVNGTGAGNLARAAAAVGAHLVQVSTDYVFDGTATRPYVESDPTNALSAYGRTKLAGEEEVIAASREHAVVRTAWLFGPGGKNFVTTMLRLGAGAGDELAVVTDEVGCPTYTGHLAPRLVEFAERRAAGVFHLAGAGHCSRNAFAKAIFEAAGLHLRVTETTQAQLAMAAPRPPWSVLGSERDVEPLPSWHDGLAAYRAKAPEVFGQ